MARLIRNFCLALVVVTICILPVSAITLTPGASSGTNTISNGDPVYITGIATGHPKNGLNVWFIGYNTVKITNIQVNADNTYSYEIKSAETQDLAPGQYLVIVQHPMMNGQFDIVYSAATGQVINRQMQASGGSEGTAIFRLTSAGSLQSPDAATALMNALNSQNVDDTFAMTSFTISPPNAFINPVGDHVVGDQFVISGTTNLAAGDKLQVDVYSSSFSPTSKSQSGEFSGVSGIVEVTAGSGGSNQWSFPVDSAGFRPDEYIVTVAAILQDVKGSATFNILAATPVTTALPVPTTVPAEAIPINLTTPATTVEQPAVPSTTHAGLAVWPLLCGLVTGIVLLSFQKKE